MRAFLNTVKGDRWIWLIVVALSILSILAVYSSTLTLAYKHHAGNTEFYLLKHFFLIVVGLGLMYVAHLINYGYYSRIAQIALYVSIPLLIYTLVAGDSINEAKRWLTLPGINLTFQTSDLAKLAMIMYTARELSGNQQNIKDFKSSFLRIMIPLLLVCGLIAPADLSSAGLLFATCLLLMYIGRISLKHLGITVGSGIAMMAFIVMLSAFSPDSSRIGTWKNRIVNFVSDSDGNFQVQQAKIAIANGGWIGQGPGQSAQKNILPHPYSDFIYAIIVEEYGTITALLLMLAYLIFLYRCIRIFNESRGAFGALLAIGLSFSIVFQAMINMAVTVHLIPTTGLVLPLVSMGGTSLLFMSLSVGIILSVSRYIEINESSNARLSS